jgi:hypothetical protein
MTITTRGALRYWTSGIEGRGDYYAALARAMVLRLLLTLFGLATVEGGARVASAMFTATGAAWAADHAVVRADAATDTRRAAPFATHVIPTSVPND